jgi:hypothetical protein
MPSDRYSADEIVFVRCRVVNDAKNCNTLVLGGKTIVQVIPAEKSDETAYLLEEVDKTGKTFPGARLMWASQECVISIADARRLVTGRKD